MPGTKLDPIDRKILAELQADGRMTNVELAKRVGISAPPCLRRVRTLEEQGYIRGYHADVDARELGFEVQVFAMVGLVSQAEADLIAFEDTVPRLAAGARVSHAQRRGGFHPEMRGARSASFQSFLTEELTSAPQCGQRQDIAGDPRRQGRARRAVRRARGAVGTTSLTPALPAALIYINAELACPMQA